MADQELALRDFAATLATLAADRWLLIFLRSDRRQEEGQELKIDHRFISFGGAEGGGGGGRGSELQLPVRPIDETSASHDKKGKFIDSFSNRFECKGPMIGQHFAADSIGWWRHGLTASKSQLRFWVRLVQVDRNMPAMAEGETDAGIPTNLGQWRARVYWRMAEFDRNKLGRIICRSGQSTERGTRRIDPTHPHPPPATHRPLIHQSIIWRVETPLGAPSAQKRNRRANRPGEAKMLKWTKVEISGATGDGGDICNSLSIHHPIWQVTDLICIFKSGLKLSI